MTGIAAKKNNPVLIILLGSLIVLLIMQPWNLYFLNDDFEHIPLLNDNLLVRKNFLRPVANLFLFFDRHLYNKRAYGYFLTTWILHASCTIGIYYLCSEVIKRYVPDLPVHTALLTALFFLFYPFHAEPLFWIIARGSIIAALLQVLSLYYYIKKDQNNKNFLVSLLLFALALFTYESTWNCTFFYCFISYLNVERQDATKKTEVFHPLIFVAVFIAYLFTRYFLLGTFTGGYVEIDENIRLRWLLLANLVKLVARNFTPPFYNSMWSALFFCLSVIIYGFAVLLAFKKSKTVGLLLLILVFGLITAVITAAPLGIDTHGNESERYIYYSSFFFCFFLAVLTTIVVKKRLQVYFATFIILIGLTGLLVYNANYRYASTVTRTTTRFIKNYPGYQKAYFINVPGEYKGSLILRSALPNAVDWIDADCKYQAIEIVNVKEDASGKLPFLTGEKTWKDLMSGEYDNGQNGNYLFNDSLKKDFLSDKNVVFWFTGKGLYKMNMK
jgi:hypothetical protein